MDIFYRLTVKGDADTLDKAADIIEEVFQERAHQDNQNWRGLAEWNIIVGGELGEVHRAMIEFTAAVRRGEDGDEWLKNLHEKWVQVAAVAVAAIEAVDIFKETYHDTICKTE